MRPIKQKKKDRKEEEMMSDQDIIPPSPPTSNTKRLNVALFRKRKLSSSDSEPSDQPPTKKAKKLNIAMFRKENISSSDSEPSQQPKKAKKPRKREAIPCRQCGQPQLNMWRHMNKMHNETYSTKPQYDKTNFDIVKSKKGYISYTCPARQPKFPRLKCGKVVTRLREHLIKYHKMINGSPKIKKMLKLAEPILKKKTEEEKTEVTIISSDSEEIASTDPEISEVEDNSTYLVTPIKRDDLSDQFMPTQRVTTQASMSTVTVKPIKREDILSYTYNARQISTNSSAATSECSATETTDISDDLFFHNETMKAFMKHLQETGLPKTQAMQSAAEAFHIWKKIDRAKTIGGLSNSRMLDNFLAGLSPQETSPTTPLIPCFNSMVQLIQFGIKKAIIPTFDIINAKEVINKIGRIVKLFKTNYVVKIETDREDQSNESNIESEDEMNIETQSQQVIEILSDSDQKSNDSSVELKNQMDTLSESEPDDDIPLELVKTQFVHADSDQKQQQSRESDESDTDIDSDSDLESIDKPPEDNNFKQNIYKNPLAKEFHSWLRGIPYMHSGKGAAQHVSQSFKMWEEMAHNFNFSATLEKTALNRWFTNALDRHRPGTILSYMGSFTKLIQFLQDTRVFRVEEDNRARKLLDHISLLKKTLKRRKRIRQAEVDTEEIQNMIKPEDIGTFLQSPIAKHCEELAKAPCKELVQGEFYDIRDYLLLRLIQSNAQRPQAIRAITQRTVQQASVDEEGWATLAVAEHKTAHSSGPAIIVLSPEIYFMLKNFINLIKRIPTYTADTERSIFTSWPKPDNQVVPMNSSQVNVAINRLWAMGPVQKRITATKIRKSTTTHVRKTQPDSRETLAIHMSHDPKTADKYYHLVSRKDNAPETCKLIKSVMEGGEKTVEDSIHWPKPEPVRISVKTDQESSEEDTDEYDVSSYSKTKPNPILFADNEDKNVDKLTHRRRSFSQEESQTLIALCEGNLNNNNVCRASIKTSVLATPKGQNLATILSDRFENKDIWKKIVDRIHVERKRRSRLREVE